MRLPIELLEMVTENISEEVLIDKTIKELQSYRKLKFESSSGTEKIVASIINSEDFKKFLEGKSEEKVKEFKDNVKKIENRIPPPILSLTMLATKWVEEIKNLELETEKLKDE